MTYEWTIPRQTSNDTFVREALRAAGYTPLTANVVSLAFDLFHVRLADGRACVGTAEQVAAWLREEAA